MPGAKVRGGVTYMTHSTCKVRVNTKREGITNLKIYQYWIFHLTCSDLNLFSDAKNPQKTWNYDTIHIMYTTIFKIVLKLDK